MRAATPWWLVSCLALVGALGLACGGGGGVQKTDALDRDAAWAMAREAVAEGRRCYENNPAFCPSDAGRIDGFIQAVLDERHQGAMPTRPFDVRHVGQLATTAYHRWMASDEGRGAVEALVRAAWELPAVSEDPKGVTVALSVLPCRLGVKLRTTDTLSCIEPDAGLLDRGQPATAVVAELLERYAASYPAAAAITVTVPVPGSTSRVVWQYRYDRAAGLVEVGKKGDPPAFTRKAKVSAGFGPFRSGAASLHTLDLR